MAGPVKVRDGESWPTATRFFAFAVAKFSCLPSFPHFVVSEAAVRCRQRNPAPVVPTPPQTDISKSNPPPPSGPSGISSTLPRHPYRTRRLPPTTGKMKYVLVSGGVISGVGKGIIASSAGLLLKTMGLKVSSIKIDPYINVDAGTMNPREHGEVYVLDDGGEVDLDLGNYERYLNITLTRENNITLGKIYRKVIEQERRGDYLGKTVQVVPHVTGCIEQWIERVAKVPVDDTNEEPDVCIVELGGTIGDIEGMAFVEALTELRRKCPREDFMQIHVSYIPVVHGEQKTKPTQMAIKGKSQAAVCDLGAC
jgi:hypothetical protein